VASIPRSLSVVLATHRGEAFLEEQLDSIAGQSRTPDEVVLVDDASDDSTLAIARAWASTRPFPVRVEAGAVRTGARGAFSRGIALATGDVIVLSDQDDVWLPHRLEDVGRVFEADPTIGLAFADALLVDGAGAELGETLWRSVGLDDRRRAAYAADPFAALVHRNDVTGATAAFRSALRDLVLPIPPAWVHDGWIAILAAAVARVALLERPAIRYRQHGGNLIGARVTSFGEDVGRARGLAADAYDEEAARYEAVAARLAARGVAGPDDPRAALLAAKAFHFRRRADVRRHQAPRLSTVVEELVNRRYGRFSLGWKSVARDLVP
jgi:glycosyltransferase involved in cell wall biosynthesis